MGGVHHREIVEDGPGGGGILQQASAAAEEHIAFAQGRKHLAHVEPGHRLQAKLAARQGGVLGKDGNAHFIADFPDGLVDGIQNGIVTGVGKAIVAAHDHVVFPLADLAVDLQGVQGHTVQGIVGHHRFPAIAAQTVLLLLRQGPGLQDLPAHPLRRCHRVGAAAEVGVDTFGKLFRGKEAGVALGAGEDHGLPRRHSLQGRPGYAHKEVAGGHHLPDIRPGPGEDQTRPSQSLVHSRRLLPELCKGGTAAGNEDAHTGDGLIQRRGDLDQLTGDEGRLLVQAAHMADHRSISQGKLLPHRCAGGFRGKFLRVDAVDGQVNMLPGDLVLRHQVVPDILGDGQGPLTPVGKGAQNAADLIDAMAGGDKGELHLLCQKSAEHGGDAGVGVDDVRLFPLDDLF